MNIKIKYSQDVFVWHHRRPNLFSHLKQLSNYGLHRGYFARHFPATSFRLKYFLPSFLLLSAVVLIFSLILKFAQLKIISSALLLTYFLSVLSTLISMLSKYNILHLSILFFYTSVSHLFYGFHFMRGFLKFSPLQSKLRAE
jgi:hypothetical protein